MSNYTQGEWVYWQTFGGFDITTVGKYGIRIAKVNTLEPEGLYNAKLIAAAPDLLQIAKQVVFMLENYPKGSMGKELAESAQAAINKATK